MDSWERFNETSLPPKNDFYSELTLEDIFDKGYNHAEKYLKNFAQTSVIIMICIFSVIHYCLKMFLKNLDTHVLIYTDPSYLLSAPELAWQA